MLGKRSDTVELQGTQYEGRTPRIEALSRGDDVTLAREPANKYDGNAIDVRDMQGGSLGHIPAELAAEIAPLLDGGRISIASARVTEMVPRSARGPRAKKPLLKVTIVYEDQSLRPAGAGGERNDLAGVGDAADLVAQGGILLKYNGQRTDVTIPDSVIEIGDGAFSGCTSLVSVTIPRSVTQLTWGAFSGCTSLVSVTILYSVSEIGGGAFEGCSSLVSVTIPDSVIEIGDGAFSGCTSLVSITIPGSVKKLGQRAFEGCTSLASVAIPDSVKQIGAGAFSGCTSLVSITIPRTVKKIGAGVFGGCTSLVSVTIPDSVTELGGGAFSGCTSLASVTLPDSVKKIGNRAFADCSSLTSLRIPPSVMTIGDWAFAGCSGLVGADGVSVIEMPRSGITVGERALPVGELEVDGLSYEVLNSSSVKVDSVDQGGLPDQDIYEVVIPETVDSGGHTYFVTEIGRWAFNDLEWLTSVGISDSVTTIGECAFANCANLVRMAIPGSVKSIGEGAFQECTALALLKLSEGLESIHAEAFEGCSMLRSVSVPASLKSIDASAFPSKTKLIKSKAEGGVSPTKADSDHIRREAGPEGPLLGSVVVFTGALQMPRREAADLAAKAGCKVTDNVGKSTTLLVVGDQDVEKLQGYEKSSKHRKAEDLIAVGQQIRIIGESEFLRLVEAQAV